MQVMVGNSMIEILKIIKFNHSTHFRGMKIEKDEFGNSATANKKSITPQEEGIPLTNLNF